MPIYSFGLDSPLKFDLSEEYVDAYNRATKAFFEAQDYHLTITGTRWEPPMLLNIAWTEEEQKAFNGFNEYLKKALELHGTPIQQDDITEDYLVLNP